jgi:hypothetical protein
MHLKRVAIIDSYEGNGHCFSFPAIMNGWNSHKKHICPYRAIPEYLTKYSTPNLDVEKAFRATRVWMREKQLAQDVSEFARVTKISMSPLEAIKDCDVAFLLNDEPDDRNSLLNTLISTGKPIFVDKLLTRRATELSEIRTSQILENQIFSASGMKYAPVFDALVPFLETGETYITVPKSWPLYGIHAVELFLQPTLLGHASYEVIGDSKSMGLAGRILKIVVSSQSTNRRSLVYLEASGQIDTPFSVKQISLEGVESYFELKNPFLAFVRLILDFYEYLESNARVHQYWSNQRSALEILSR